MAERKTTPKRARAPRARVLPLPASLDIAGADELKQVLSAALDSAKPIKLNATAVEHVDAAGMQLLLVFCNSARAQGLKTTWTGAPPRLKEAAALLGMAAALGLET